MLLAKIRQIPLLKSFAVMATVAIVLELGGIWRELRHIRLEQVKTEQIGSALAVDDNISVKVENDDGNPVAVEAAETVPVEIQR